MALMPVTSECCNILVNFESMLTKWANISVLILLLKVIAKVIKDLKVVKHFLVHFNSWSFLVNLNSRSTNRFYCFYHRSFRDSVHYIQEVFSLWLSRFWIIWEVYEYFRLILSFLP